MEGSSGRNKRKRSSRTYAFAATDSEDESFNLDAPMDDVDNSTAEINIIPEQELGKTRATPVVIVDSGFSTVRKTSQSAPAANISYIGSALKKTSDGSAIAPRVVTKAAKRKTVRFRRFTLSLGSEANYCRCSRRGKVKRQKRLSK
jgi:ATP-dependent RNA helicase DHX37/DHR1